MSCGERLRKKLEEQRKKMQELKQRGIERTEQQKAEKLRKKQNKMVNMKPGARKAIIEGVALKKNPLDVMKDEYERRKYERKQKAKDKDN